MNKIFGKIISLTLTVILICLMLPFAVSAEGAVIVYSDAELRAALENGGEIIVDGYFGPDLDRGPYVITKDTVIYMNYSMNYMAYYRSDWTDMPIFQVEGASLTLDTLGYGGFDYYGHGSMFELVGNENATTSLIVLTGNYNTYPFDDMSTGERGAAVSLFETINPQNAEVGIFIYGGSFCNRDKQYMSDAPVFGGENFTACIKGGNFNTNISEKVPEGYAAINQFDSYRVLPITDTKGSAIESMLDADGKFIVKRFEPEEKDLDMLMFALDMLYNEGNPDVYLTFYWPSYDFETHTVYASRTNEPWGEPEETYLLELKYVYDPAIKTQIDEVVDKIPQGELNEWGDYEPYYFEVSDLALLNYWQTWYWYFDEYFEEEMPNDNIDNLILYSKEFKELIGYKNFGITIGAGDGGPFYSECFGDGEFRYGDTVYAAKLMGARANSIFYVPENTADDDILSVLQQRIDNYLGEGAVSVEEKGLVLDRLLLWEYEGMGYEEPFEDWKASLDLSEYNVAEMAEVEGLGNDAMCYSVTINDIEHLFVALKDDNKISSPEYLNIDVLSNVSVATSNSSVPLDTLIKVDSLSDEEQSKMLDRIGAEEGKTYDIKLYSNSKNSYITALENGQFEVEIPVPEEYLGENLVVYYIDDNDVITPYTVTFKEDGKVASFTTDHFSKYTLAISSVSVNGDVTGDNKVDICDLVAVGMAARGAGEIKEIYDINGDSAVDWTDVEIIRQLILQ